MDKSLLSFFVELLETPSPAGFETEVQKVFKRFTADCADEVQSDVNGNAIAVKKGTGKKRILLVGHCDEIGLMVKYVDDNGYLRFGAIGGVDVNILQGQKVDVHGRNGVVRGVIGKKPYHLMKRDGSERQLSMEELWIDIGAKHKQQAQEMVSVADPVTFTRGVDFLPNGLITSKAIDDKVGVFIIAAVLKALQGKQTEASIYAASVVQEEIGCKGAHTATYQVSPDIGIAIDVTHATDYPSIDKANYGDILMNGGPVIARGSRSNRHVFNLLIDSAAKAGVAYQVEPIAGDSRTDVEAVHISRSGVATGIVSIPCRYMHTPGEVVSLNDIEAIVKTLTEFCLSVKDDTNLIP